MKKVMIVLCLFFTLYLSATIINIPADYSQIQLGIEASADGDTILVQPGTYYENINYNGKNITVASLFYTTQDTSYISQTIIDGYQNGRVVTFDSGEDAAAVISGLTITHGIAYYGGGIYCSNNSNPTLSNIIISDNLALGRGGGIFCQNSSLQLSDLTINGNSASEEGGGIFCRNSDLILFNVSILNNVSYLGEWNTGGGGIHCRSSTVDMENVNFHLNTAAGSGGGLYCNSTILNISNSEFFNNHSLYDATPENNQFGGGGMFCYTGSSYLENVTFLFNDAIANGGGLGLNMSDTIMKNVYFTNNSALMRGGGVYMNQSESELINLLVANNISGLSGGGLSVNVAGIYPLFLTNISIVDNISILGGGICTKLGGPRLTNCILWNNEPEEIYGIDHSNGPPEITIEYSDIQDGEAGINLENGTVNWLEGNINEDPLFLGIGEHPYSLSASSPCINAGIPDTTGLNLPEYDLAGNPRIFADRIDMGAYEFPGNAAPIYLEINNETLSWQMPEGFSPTGYNIYLDGEFLTTLYDNVTEYTFLDLIQGNTYTAGVSALYGTEETAIISLEFLYDPVSSEDETIDLQVQISNYPNPFNPQTTIKYNLNESGLIKIEIYNIKGQLVNTLVNQFQDTGVRSIVWNGDDSNGNQISSGLYFYRLNINGKSQAKNKCLLLK